MQPPVQRRLKHSIDEKVFTAAIPDDFDFRYVKIDKSKNVTKGTTNMKIMAGLTTAISLTGCMAVQPAKEPGKLYEEGYLQIASSGFIGCEPTAIKVSDVVTHNLLGGIRAWRATCKSAAFICSEVQAEGAYQLNCSAEQ